MRLLEVLSIIVVMHYISYAQSATCAEKCNESSCSPPSNCYAGIVKDKCSCCYVCAQLEGQRCYNQSIKSLPESHQRYAKCGEFLECRLRDDLAEGDDQEAICVCTSEEALCGSDGKTYENQCKLTEARYRQRDGLIAVARGPCKVAPKIVTPPVNMQNETGVNLAFTCEASGYPIPMIEWRFVAQVSMKEGEAKYEAETVRSLKSLPADDTHIAVQARGGPNTYETTSWLQILRTRLDDSGLYYCVASNSEGEDSAYSTLVIDSNKENEISYK